MLLCLPLRGFSVRDPVLISNFLAKSAITNLCLLLVFML